MKHKRVLMQIVLMFTLISVNAQELSIYTGSNMGLVAKNKWIGGKRGALLGINFLKPIKNDFYYMIGSEIGTASWGTNLLMNIGISFNKVLNEKLTLNINLQTNQGLAMFSPKSLYVYGFTTLTTLDYWLNNKFCLGIGTGLKYYNCPGYKDYSTLSSYLDIPIQINLKINFDSKKPE